MCLRIALSAKPPVKKISKRLSKRSSMFTAISWYDVILVSQILFVDILLKWGGAIAPVAGDEEYELLAKKGVFILIRYPPLSLLDKIQFNDLCSKDSELHIPGNTPGKFPRSASIRTRVAHTTCMAFVMMPKQSQVRLHG